MKFDCKQINIFGKLLQIPLPESVLTGAETLLQAIKDGKEITVEVKVKKQHRSLTANGLMWVLCQKLAEELSKNGITTKEDVYREAIRKASIRPFVVPVKNEAVEHWQSIWQDKGVGWVTENWGAAKTPGYTLIASYPGSSTFDTAEMARLIDVIVDECHELNIETRPQAEIDSLLAEWSRDVNKS